MGRSGSGLVKRLQQAALVVGVDQDAEVLDPFVVFLDGGVPESAAAVPLRQEHGEVRTVDTSAVVEVRLAAEAAGAPGAQEDREVATSDATVMVEVGEAAGFVDVVSAEVGVLAVQGKAELSLDLAATADVGTLHGEGVTHDLDRCSEWRSAIGKDAPKGGDPIEASCRACGVDERGASHAFPHAKQLGIGDGATLHVDRTAGLACISVDVAVRGVEVSVQRATVYGTVPFEPGLPDRDHFVRR